MAYVWKPSSIPYRNFEIILLSLSSIILAIFLFIIYENTNNLFIKYSTSAILVVVIFYQLGRVNNLLMSNSIAVYDDFVEINCLAPLEYGMIRSKFKVAYEDFYALDLISKKVYNRKIQLLKLKGKRGTNLEIGFGSSEDDLKELAGELSNYITPSNKVMKYLGLKQDMSLKDMVIEKTKEVASKKVREFMNKNFRKGD